MLPPIPPKAYRPAPGVTQGDGARKLIERPRKTVTPQRTLVWNWQPDRDNNWTNTVWIVRGSPAIGSRVASWPVLGVAHTNFWMFNVTPSAPHEFFSVSSSNTASRLVSD